MSTLKKFALPVGVVLALVFSVYALNRAGQAVVNQVAPSFGAVPTLDGVDNPYYSIGGVRFFNQNSPVMASSTRLCSIQNPFRATSTISSISVQITGTGISGANTYSISTSTTAYASSTPVLVLDHTIPANSSNSMVWYPMASTSNANPARILGNSPTGESNIIVYPNEYLNVALATTTGAGALTTYYTGSCKAVWRAL